MLLIRNVFVYFDESYVVPKIARTILGMDLKMEKANKNRIKIMKRFKNRTIPVRSGNLGHL